MASRKRTVTDPAAVHAALAAIDLIMVPVVATERHTHRKVRAKLTRELPKRLGVSGISVTTPRYSMATAVDVLIPARSDYTLRHPDGTVNWAEDPAALSNSAAEATVRAILARAFPNHDDRSDSTTDYFDNPWSVTLKT
jgi:hypothetical protein